MLTDGQKTVMGELVTRPGTARHLAMGMDRLNNPNWTHDRITKILRRLEDKGLVRRFNYPAEWELTALGRQQYKQSTVAN